MSSDADAAGAHSPEDWETEPERHYARAQASLAAEHGVDGDARTAHTESAGRVHFLDAGDPDGEPVVLLHGVSTTAATWLPMLPALADDYRLVVPDRPGRGLSDSPNYRGRDLRSLMTAYLAELFDALGLEGPHVVGNSLGGLQAFLLALDHDGVDRLCLVGAPGGVSRDLPLLARLTTVHGMNRLLDWLTARGDPVENAEQSTRQVLVADDDAVSPAFYDLLAASQQMPERRRSLRSLQLAQGSFGRAHPTFDLRDEIAGIERPTCFLWGTEDSFWSPDVGRPVAESMPDAEFHELASYGHAPWLEPGDDVGARVRAFLGGNRQAGPDE
jgi:2-hydroxymuconate-semialdehyde hydrolase